MLDDKELKEFMKNKEKELGKPFNIISFIKASKEFAIQDNKKNDNINDAQYKRNKELVSITFDFCLAALKDFNINEEVGSLVTYLKDDDTNGTR